MSKTIKERDEMVESLKMGFIFLCILGIFIASLYYLCRLPHEEPADDGTSIIYDDPQPDERIL